MTAKSMRSFAGGLIVAASVCGAVYFLGPDEKTNSQTTDQPSVAEMKSQLASEGYVIHTEKEWNEQMQALNEKVKAKPETTNYSKEKAKEKVVYRTIITVSKGMTSIDVGKSLKKAQIIKISGFEFSKEVEKRKLESELRPGTYKVDSDMTLDEVIKAIFKK